MDFGSGFLWMDFGMLHVILSEFLTKAPLEHTVNPTYLIGCCDWTPVQPCPQDFCTDIQHNL